MGVYEAVRAEGAIAERQTSAWALMIEPAGFGFNPETAASNRFAEPHAGGGVAAAAAREFEGLRTALGDAGIGVVTLSDTPRPPKPDALFPNNWVSFHTDGSLVVYPMEAVSRRAERRLHTLVPLLGRAGFTVTTIVDLTAHEAQGRYLEGTGSLVLDRPRRRAYACRSSRTHPLAAAEFDRRMAWSTFLFDARDPGGRPIYHTNVVMSLGRHFGLVCFDCVAERDRAALRADLALGGRTIIEVDYDQLCAFACNIIEMESAAGEPRLIMSTGALASLRVDQRTQLEALAGPIVHAAVPTIEHVSGGGVRCMIADIHLPRP